MLDKAWYPKHVWLQLHLSWLHRSGDADLMLPKDDRKADYFLSQAVATGYPPALFEEGESLAMGRGGRPVDFAGALERFERAGTCVRVRNRGALSFAHASIICRRVGACGVSCLRRCHTLQRVKRVCRPCQSFLNVPGTFALSFRALRYDGQFSRKPLVTMATLNASSVDLQRAAELDPFYAPAWRNLAACHALGHGTPTNLELARYIRDTVLPQAEAATAAAEAEAAGHQQQPAAQNNNADCNAPDAKGGCGAPQCGCRTSTATTIAA